MQIQITFMRTSKRIGYTLKHSKYLTHIETISLCTMRRAKLKLNMAGSMTMDFFRLLRSMVNNVYVDPDLVPTRPGAKRAEVWSGEQSLETWCKAEPARDLKRVLEDKKTS